MIERKPGDIRRVVYAGVLAGKTRHQIVNDSGLTPKQVYGGQQGMVLEEFLDPSMLRPRREERQNSAMVAKDSIIPVIGPFLGMWLLNLEVQHAMLISYGVTYGYDEIYGATGNARGSGYNGLRRFTKDEIKAVQKEALHKHKDQIPGRVAEWLDTAAVILTHPSHSVPGSREEWKNRITWYKQRGLVDQESTGEKWKLIVRLYFDNGRPLSINWSADGLQEDRLFVRRVLRAQRLREVKQDPKFQKKYQEAMEARAVTMSQVSPFVKRRIPLWDIAQITGLRKSQVKGATKKIWKKDDRLRQSDQEKSEVHRRGILGRKRAEPKIPTPQQANGFAFLQNIGSGVITDELSRWNQLHTLYQQEGIELPYEPAERLRLEVYLKSLVALTRRNSSLILQYQRVGREIDSEWFKQLEPHERFVRRKICCLSADGEDGKGLYRIFNGGSRAYTMSGGDSGYETSELTIRRLLQQSISPQKR